jgi:acyl-coenzyme A synthetase/AMP-(fatty) acid ligase
MLSSPLNDLSQWAETDPDRIMLVDGGQYITYSDTYHHVLSVGSFLCSTGVKKGERVGVIMSKGYLQVLSQMGVMASGAVVVPISDLLKADQVQHILNDCDIKTIIIDEDKIDRLGPYTLKVKVLKAKCKGNDVSLEHVLEMGLIEKIPEVIGQDNAAIIYTSGSTGMPKGIVISHRNFWDGARIVSTYLGLQSDDRLAQVLSLNFDYGLNQVFSAIHVGAQVYFTILHFPKDLFTFLETHEITTLALMPVFLNRLFDKRFFEMYFVKKISTLRRITTSGGRVSKEIIQIIDELLPNTDLYLMYGLTEAFRSTYLPPNVLDKHYGSIGIPIPDVQIMVLDDSGKECLVGEHGELVHRGGVVTKGYWNSSKNTLERFKPWVDASGNIETVVYSGDIVYRDADGYLYFVGRHDNMIKTSGHRVSPEEIERAVELMESVDYAVVFGRDHSVLGEEIVLVCVNKKECQSENSMEIKNFLRKKLASYMIPHKVLFHDDFEITAGNQGKFDRTVIKHKALVELEHNEENKSE